MSERSGPSWPAWFGVILVLGVLGVYLFTLSPVLYPGESADLVLRYTGVLPRLAPENPLWLAAVRAIDAVPIGSSAWRLNVFSALCGALALWLLYGLMRATVEALGDTSGLSERRLRWAGVLAGSVSVLALAFAAPFWIVSTRAHPGAFHVLLVLLAARLFRAAAGGSYGWLLLCAFLCGLGLVEFATFALLMPLFAIAFLVMLWREGRLRSWPILGLVGAGLMGMLGYVAAAWQFSLTEGYLLRNEPALWTLMTAQWHNQFMTVARSLPREGALLVLLLSVAPWLVALVLVRRGLQADSDGALVLVHVVLTGLAVAVCLNVRFAPWAMLGFMRLLVTPYVLTAALLGYLAVYWFFLPVGSWNGKEGWMPGALGRVLALLFGTAFVGVTLFAGWKHLAVADARSAAVIDHAVKAVVAELDDCRWLVTDGEIDALLMHASRREGIDLTVINLASGNQSYYRHFVGLRMDSARRRNLAGLSLFHLLKDLLQAPDAGPDTMAMMTSPDLFVAQGYVAVPSGAVMRAALDRSRLDPEALWARHVAFWDSVLWPLLPLRESPQQPVMLAAADLLRHASMVANNLGVLYEDMSRPAMAVQAYTRARELYRENLSALLNLARLASAGQPVEGAEALQSEVKRLAEDELGPRHLWRLSQFFGYVREPAAYYGMGWLWAYSGQPGMAESSMERALSLANDAAAAGIRKSLAGIHERGGDAARSEAIYLEVLEQGEDPEALLALVTLAAQRRGLDDARAYLERARAAGASGKRLDLTSAFLAMVDGRDAEAIRLLEALLNDEDVSVDAMGLLGELLRKRQDEAGLDGLLTRAANRHPQSSLYYELAGHRAMLRMDIRAARQLYETAYRQAPQKRHLLVTLIDLAMRLGDMGSCEQWARQLVLAQPDHALANYVLGSQRLADGKHELAEDFLRRSVANGRIPAAANDLAWLLYEKGAYAEASVHAEEALAMRPDLYEAWDTLAAIRIAQGRLDEAEEALRKALELNSTDPGMALQLAEIFLLRDQLDLAGARLTEVEEKRGRLSSAQHKKFLELKAALKQRRR